MLQHVKFPTGYLFLGINLLPLVLSVIAWKITLGSGIESQWRKIIFTVSLCCVTVGALSLVWFWTLVLLRTPSSRFYPHYVVPMLSVCWIASLISLVTALFGWGTGRTLTIVSALIVIPLCYLAIQGLIF